MISCHVWVDVVSFSLSPRLQMAGGRAPGGVEGASSLRARTRHEHAARGGSASPRHRLLAPGLHRVCGTHSGLVGGNPAEDHGVAALPQARAAYGQPPAEVQGDVQGETQVAHGPDRALHHRRKYVCVRVCACVFVSSKKQDFILCSQTTHLFLSHTHMQYTHTHRCWVPARRWTPTSSSTRVSSRTPAPGRSRAR
jgi:hypothetical protein